jgi:hypothetical protein
LPGENDANHGHARHPVGDRDPEARRVLLEVFAELRGLPRQVVAQSPAYDFGLGSPRGGARRGASAAARSGRVTSVGGIKPMPPLVSHIVDDAGVALVNAWIGALGDAGLP